MGSVSRVKEGINELVKNVQRLALLGVRLMSISESGVTVQHRVESSLVVEVNKKQDSDSILVDF